MDITKNQKKALPLLVILSTFLFLIPLVSAVAVTLTDPATSGGEVGNFTWNITIGGADAGAWGDVTNCSIYLRSTSTANSTYVNVDSVNNATVNASYFFESFTATNYIEDSNDYSVYASCTNQTGYIQNSSASTSVFVNTGVPTAATIVGGTDGTSFTTNSFSIYGTVVGQNTTGCNIFFDQIHPGSSSYAMTHSADNCSYAFSGVPELTYKYVIQASDGTNTTNTSLTTISLDTTSSGVSNEVLEGLVGQEDQEALGSGLSNTTKGVLVVVVVAILIMIIKRRK